MCRGLCGRRQFLARRRHRLRGGVDLGHCRTQRLGKFCKILGYTANLILSAHVLTHPNICRIVRTQIETGKVLYHALQVAHRRGNPAVDKDDQAHGQQDDASDSNSNENINHVVRIRGELVIARRCAHSPLLRNTVKRDRRIDIKCILTGGGRNLFLREWILRRPLRNILRLHPHQFKDILHDQVCGQSMGNDRPGLGKERIELICRADPLQI